MLTFFILFIHFIHFRK